VVEGQHVGPGGHPAQVFRSVCEPITTSGVTCCGGIVGSRSQHPQVLPERDRGLMGHPAS